MIQPSASCFSFDKQVVFRAASRAWANTGNKMAARIAIIAITTSSSIRVKPLDFLIVCILFVKLCGSNLCRIRANLRGHLLRRAYSGREQLSQSRLQRPLRENDIALHFAGFAGLEGSKVGIGMSARDVRI